MVLAWVHADNPPSCIICAEKAPMQNSHVKEFGAAVGMGAEEENHEGKKKNNAHASEKQAISITGGVLGKDYWLIKVPPRCSYRGSHYRGTTAVISRMRN